MQGSAETRLEDHAPLGTGVKRKIDAVFGAAPGSELPRVASVDADDATAHGHEPPKKHAHVEAAEAGADAKLTAWSSTRPSDVGVAEAVDSRSGEVDGHANRSMHRDGAGPHGPVASETQVDPAGAHRARYSRARVTPACTHVRTCGTT